MRFGRFGFCGSCCGCRSLQRRSLRQTRLACEQKRQDAVEEVVCERDGRARAEERSALASACCPQGGSRAGMHAGRTARGGRVLSRREGEGSGIARTLQMAREVGVPGRRGRHGTEGWMKPEGKPARHGGEAVRGVALPARGWIACQKSVTDAGSIMVPVVRVVVPISGRPNGLKAGHGKPKRFPTEKTSRLRSFVIAVHAR